MEEYSRQYLFRIRLVQGGPGLFGYGSFRTVPVFGSEGSSREKVFSVSAQIWQKGWFRFLFRFLKRVPTVPVHVSPVPVQVLGNLADARCYHQELKNWPGPASIGLKAAPFLLARWGHLASSVSLVKWMPSWRGRGSPNSWSALILQTAFLLWSGCPPRVATLPTLYRTQNREDWEIPLSECKDTLFRPCLGGPFE